MIKAQVKLEGRFTVPLGKGYTPWQSSRSFAWMDMFQVETEFEDMNALWDYVETYKLPANEIRDNLEAYKITVRVNYSWAVGEFPTHATFDRLAVVRNHE